MSLIKIEFDTTLVPITFKDGKVKDYTLRPLIPIVISSSISHKKSKTPIDCLLDSGADRNLFPASMGENIGIKITKGQKTTHTGIGNSIMEAYRHTISIHCGGISFITSSDFSYQQTIPLLGRDGFFMFFQSITFINRGKVRLIFKTKNS